MDEIDGKREMESTAGALERIQPEEGRGRGRVEISDVVSLVEKAKEGDRAAFEGLMRAYAGFVYSLAFRMLGERAEAEDVFQETFLSAWSHMESFRTGGNFTAWIKRIATNLCIDRLKAQRRRQATMASGEIGQIPPPARQEQAAEPGDRLALVNRLLAELPAHHRAAVVLFYLEGRSVEEAARTLKQKPGTVKVWLFRAREKMKAALEASGYEL
ncbi:MAG: RNA polymerase sigma factor [Acidobacteria bacterium]|nr:RNA polymerase sigma factor [Acidobacteriota bacterium]